ncbi:uncharacterized protein Z520_08006 [Fonsecaea multimorphosa CBS 102226]|uniref:FAD-binding domain-containing protein n=1 Tax=Fonsecaea multimorphosa CBS 102226 TaxID=1442371 RepID=A0A0D2KHS8_9EURO|nr:uncharacterized protein Z520_08006 [Fonsecaea multimorphosa CBS 102226]KIX96228.1 hypothetical protein Z520_08006 [Fonsecaea multimorphosa CBS 102226]OAL22195.1 hypothetical protein AYO22_07239 [Fonsecaea multimorphosa]
MTDFWPKKPFSIAIIGGGLAGLSLARGLLRRGISCQVFEAAPAFADIGAGLSFALNSLEALKAVDPDSYECFLKRCNEMSEKKDVYMTYRDGNAEDNHPLTTLYCKGSGQQAVHRTLLVKDMVSLMPEGTWHMDKRLTTIEENPSGGVSLSFEDGTMFDADAVVGADGIKSRTRQILLGADNPDAKPKYSGEFGYRSLVPMDKAAAVLGEDFAKNGNVNISDGALTTTYPVEKGTMLNVVAARDQPTWDDPSWVIPANKEMVEEEFKETGPQMQKVVSLLENPQKWSLWHHPDATTFYRGRFCIIGDAAHAATPHQGAGAGQAFEDALVLARLLADDNIKTADDIQTAFAAFDAIRRPRTLKIVDTSRENGEICMKKGEDTGADLEKIKNNLDHRFNWIWYDNLEGQVEEAKDKLKDLKGPEFEEDKRSPSQREALDESTLEASYRPAILRNESLSQLGAPSTQAVKV